MPPRLLAALCALAASTVAAAAAQSPATVRRDAGPGAEAAGFASLYGEPGLVVTPHEERARWAAAQAGELSRSLQAMPGVATARVHLALPDPARAQLDTLPAASRASVLIVRRGEEPIDTQAVAALVAGAVEQLPAERVEVVVSSQPAPQADPVPLAKLGPLTVTRQSAPQLKLVLLALLSSNLLLAAVVVALIHRARRGGRR